MSKIGSLLQKPLVTVPEPPGRRMVEADWNEIAVSRGRSLKGVSAEKIGNLAKNTQLQTTQ